MNSTAPQPPAPHGGALVSWVLLLMGLFAFAPCVILPDWRNYQALHMAQQVEQHHLERMQSLVDQERRRLEAVQSDPAVVARLAKRDLRYRDPGEIAVRVDLPPQGETGDASTVDPFVPEPVSPPGIFGRLADYLPQYPYDQVFCDEHTRIVLMTMALVMIVLGLCLHPPKPVRRTPQT